MNYHVIRYSVIAVLCAAFVSSAAAADFLSAPANSAQAESLNALVEQVFGDISEPEHKADTSLISKVQAEGKLPVIVRLRDADMPFGFFADTSAARPEVIKGLQSAVVAEVIAHTARNEADLHVKHFSIVPGMALLADPETLEALLEIPNVVDIVEDIAVPPVLDVSVPLIGAGLDGSFDGYTGDGWAVAILDTGVDKTHPFLSGKVVSEACYSNYYDGGTSVCPGGVKQSTAVGSGVNCAVSSACSHGTHVAGIAAGSNATFSGVAKDADIIAIQVFTRIDDTAQCGGSAPCVLSYTSDQILGLERVYALRNTFKIASANMSLSGGSSAAPCNTATQKPIIDILRAAGIATVIASGNSGLTNAIGSPACIESAVSVGSTTDADVVSSFTNSAYFLSLLAPGSSINSSVPGTTYQSWNGTSMAAPHVAGAWAVLKQAKPDASVDEILEALKDTGVPVTDTRVGAGNRVKPRINVAAAVDALSTCETDDNCSEEKPFCVDGTCAECVDKSDCPNDSLFCTGVPTCTNGSCGFAEGSCSGATPGCNEATDRCVECTNNTHCPPGYRCTGNACAPGGTMVVTKATVKAGKVRGLDSISFSGSLNATNADLTAAIGRTVTVTIESAYIPAPGAITYTFQVPAASVIGGKYKSPKVTSVNKTAPVTSFSLDTIKRTMSFSAKNVDLTGLACPITFRVQFGDYAAETQVNENIVNGTKPCPLPLVMGVKDSLDVLKVSGKNGTTPGTDSVSISGTFTIDGYINPASPVEITLGSDTFTVPGAQFLVSNGVYSCKSFNSGDGFVTAKFDTVKCTYSISIQNAAVSGSGNVAFGINVFGNSLLKSGTVALPLGF